MEAIAENLYIDEPNLFNLNELMKEDLELAMLKQFIRQQITWMPLDVLAKCAGINWDNLWSFVNYNTELINYELTKLAIYLNIRFGYSSKWCPTKKIDIDYIQKIVCGYFNISISLMQSNTRKREIVQPRQIAMYLSKAYTKSSLSTIGSQIGDKDHATVLHACKTVNNLLETDKQFKEQIGEIEKLLKK